MAPEEVFARVAASVVVVRVFDQGNAEIASGSGVIISRENVVTNCHVVEDGSIVYVERGGERRRVSSAVVPLENPTRDLCMLEVDVEFLGGAPVEDFVSATELQVGQSVFAIGAPLGLELTMTRGIVSSIRYAPKIGGTIIQTDASISPGSSGGGLFDEQGRLVGITTFRLKDAQNLNFALPSQWVGELRDVQEMRKWVASVVSALKRRSTETPVAAIPTVRRPIVPLPPSVIAPKLNRFLMGESEHPQRGTFATRGAESDLHDTLTGYARQLSEIIGRSVIYPKSLQRRRIEGTTVLRIRIGRGAKVIDVSVDESSGHSELDAVSLEAVRRLRGIPALPSALGNRDVVVRIPLRFWLDD